MAKSREEILEFIVQQLVLEFGVDFESSEFTSKLAKASADQGFDYREVAQTMHPAMQNAIRAQMAVMLSRRG